MVIVTEISEDEVPAESSSSSSTLSGYDVFLSFRGTDTRNTFISHLNKALNDANIDTFLDEDDIQTGEELKPELVSAIKASRSSIVVLSRNYASSTWCLDELVLILEQSKTSQHIVYPIFYDIEPTHVRKQESSFGEAMAKHKQNKKDEVVGKIKLWEKALTKVANIKGKETKGRRETELIKDIVKEMSNRLGLPDQRNLPHLVGRVDSISSITSFMEKRNTGIITIWGMAGIGKTCLAEYIFESHRMHFERCSFLEDIERKYEEKHGLLDLQKQLLKDIRDGRWMDIRNTNVGTSRIEKLLPRERTLLVLDGINKVEQLDVLIGKKGLHWGSKIIVTSQNGLLTENCRLFEAKSPPEHETCELKGLGEEESLELLSLHAFRGNGPKEGDEQESMKGVVYNCEGHPLALKVLGSSIRNGDATWDDILELLGKDPDIQKVLKTSFYSLPLENDRQLFKLIACFYVGKDRDYIERMLTACEICRSSGINILINRCLVTIGFPNTLRMHKLLQDLGRDIVYQESPMEPGERSLLWNHEECLDVLKKSKGTRKVEGLVFDMKRYDNETSSGSSNGNDQNFGDDLHENFRSSPPLHWVRLLLSVTWCFGWISELRSSFHQREKGGVFETRTLSKMHNLRILQLNYVQLIGPYENFPDSIRWLCMHGFPLSYIPSDLQMENMVALDLSDSKLQQLWKKQPKQLLKSLKYLNLSGCRELLSVGHFSMLPQLETLILEGCTSLIEICESIGKCENLVILDMYGCNKIKGIPKSIGKLKKLKTLKFTGGSNLNKFPVEIEVVEANNVNIGSQVAFMEGIRRRRPKPSVISLPSSLVTLSLINCNLTTESFPLSFSSLSRLQTLYLNENPIVSLPDCVSSLGKLDILFIERCRRLKTALRVPSTLGTLMLGGCESLEKVTFYPETFVHVGLSHQCPTDVQSVYPWVKVLTISEVNEEILHGLGWIDIQDVKIEYDGEIHPAKMRLTIRDANVRFQGEKLPNWITHRSNESSISITIPSSPNVRGFNICMVIKDPDTKVAKFAKVELNNLTKRRSHYTYLMFFASEYNKGIVWLCHWTFGNNFFEEGDEINVYYDSYQGEDKINPTEFGISLVYYDEKNNEAPSDFYKAAYDDPYHYRSTLDLKVAGP